MQVSNYKLLGQLVIILLCGCDQNSTYGDGVTTKDSCKIPILVDEIGTYESFSTSSDTFLLHLDNGNSAKIILCNCKGKMTYKEFKDTLMVKSGNYEEAKEFTVDSVINFDPISGKEIITIEKHFSPTKTGTWIFRDSSGKIFKREM